MATAKKSPAPKVTPRSKDAQSKPRKPERKTADSAPPAKTAQSTKESARKTATPYVKLLIADEFRVESTGKVLGVGIFPDAVIVAHVPRGAPDPSPESPAEIPLLAFLITLGGVAGTHKVKVRVAEGDPSELEIRIVEAGTVANVILKAEPLVFSSFGAKTVDVEFAGKRFKLPFEIRRKEADKSS